MFGSVWPDWVKPSFAIIVVDTGSPALIFRIVSSEIKTIFMFDYVKKFNCTVFNFYLIKS